MRLTIRLSIIALFGLVIGGAALVGLRAGREEALHEQPDVPVAALPSATNTDQQIAGLLARIERLPESAEAYTSLGAAYLQKARESGDPTFYARAETALNRSLALDGENAETYLELGVLALARHQFEDGLVYGRRAHELNPYKAAALGVIGDAQVELGRYEEAAATFQAMEDRRPDLASFARLSYMRELHGDLPGAIELMKRAVIAAPGSEAHAWTQVQLGHLYFASGDLDAAEKEYERTLFQRPGYLHARAGIARIAAARGDYA
ncbi:MAG: tetratricopeptide repeat protein, partial [Dehalococcoidia bacterium]